MVIQINYIFTKLNLSIFEAIWAYKKNYISWKGVLQIAENNLSKDVHSDYNLKVLLIDASDAYSINQIIKDIEALEGNNLQHAKAKWLYLFLAWVYENIEDFEDPFQIVEEIFFQFEKPEEICEFVRFLPYTNGYEPRKNSQLENENKMLKKWRDYLDEMEKIWRGELK